MPAAELVAARQQEKEAVGALHQLRSVAPIKSFELCLRVRQEAVPGGVFAIDVPAAPQRQVHVGKQLVLHHLREIVEGLTHLRAHPPPTFVPRLPAATAPPRSGSDHSSIANASSTGSHGRSRSERVRASFATTCATRPAARKRSSSGSSAVTCCVTSRRLKAPASSLLRTLSSCTANGSAAACSSGGVSRSARGRLTGGRSGPCATSRSNSGAGVLATASVKRLPDLPLS